MKIRLTLAFLMVLLPSLLLAQDCIDYHDYLHVSGSIDRSGWSHDAVISQDYAYIADGPLVQVINISDPQNPQIVENINTPGDARAVAISDMHLYVADLSGLQVIDISDPPNWEIVGSLDMPGSPTCMEFSGDWVYVLDETSGLRVLNISDPTNPHLVTGAGTPTLDGVIELSGDYLYIGDSDSGLQVIDMSDPTNPQLVDSIGSIEVIDITISGTKAYLVSGSGLSAELLVLDISDPANLQIVGSTEFMGPTYGGPIEASGDFLYFTWNTVIGLIYFDIFDISNPTDLQHVGRISMGDMGGSSLEIADNHAYIVSSGAFHIVDISNPENPPWVGSLGTPGSARKLAFSGDYTYIADGEFGLQVVDSSDPTNMQIIESIDMPGYVRDVVVSGNHACVAEGEMLNVLDISDPASPQIVGSVEIPGGITGVEMSGTLACVVGEAFYVINISTPSNPEIVGILNIDGARGLSLSGDFAYVITGVAMGTGNLLVINISNPSVPLMVGSIGTIWPNDVVVEGDLAYMTSSNIGRMSVVDISDPSDLLNVGFVSIPGGGGRIAIAGDYAYVTYGRLQVIQITDPEDLQIVFTVPGDVSFNENLSNPVIHGTEIFFTGGEGIMVLPVHCDGTTGINEEYLELEPTDTPLLLPLLSVHPNPFNPQTTINFTLKHDQNISIDVFNPAGRHVCNLVNGVRAAGDHEITWQGRDARGRAISSGTYIIRLSTEEQVQARKITLVR